MNYTTSLNLTWEQFASCNLDQKAAFEDLTRQLFNREFCPDEHLVSSDNNPGVEVEPVLVKDGDGKEVYISFQAKHFDKRVSYKDIADSCQKAIKYFTGRLNIIYLYCNLNLNPCVSFNKIKENLENAGIKLKLIVNNAILDMLRDPKYANLALFYFGTLQLSHEWFADKADAALSSLDARFNRLFNVDTAISANVHLFVHDESAVEELNKRKADLFVDLQKAMDRGIYDRDRSSYYEKFIKCISAIPDITSVNIDDALSWGNSVKSSLNEEINALRSEAEDIDIKRREAFEARQAQNLSKDDREALDRKLDGLIQQKADIDNLLDYAVRLDLSSEEKALICNKELFIHGEAGTGKSHLLANELHTLIEADKAGILILGQTLPSSDFPEKQILSELGVDYSFSEFISLLDNYGIIHDQIVPFMIDAINETWYKEIWRHGLEKISREVEHTQNVKLIVTYRDEYKKILISDAIKHKLENGSIVSLSHYGFRGIETEAVKIFLNYYNIPFSPTFYFEYDISNPLFLSLFCRTYKKGEDQSLSTLYERLMCQVNDNVCSRLKLDVIGVNRGSLLSELSNEFCIKAFQKERRFLYRSELVALPAWKKWSLQGQEGQYITEFVAEKFFYDIVISGTPDEEEESYYFAYDHMFDYYCAKAILEANEGDTEALVDDIVNHVLNVKDGIINESDKEIFINICAILGADTGLEFFDAVLNNIKDTYNKADLIHSLLRSYSWRSTKSIGNDELSKVMKNYDIGCKDLTQLFISNSMKVGHPYNAKYMHEYLLSLPINKRDYEWTIPINGMVEDNSRLWQLIRNCERGEVFEYESEEQLRLFLILQAWLLTSSNRVLRDHTSKALVEVLEDHFELCEWLLRKFEKCNDPYVLQRLYTVVAGAVLKKKGEKKDTFHSLAIYIYSNVFDQKFVYPDILLRDSACLILDRFIYEFPEGASEIKPDVFRPPYISEDIPVVKRKKYEDTEENKKNRCYGIWNITHSLNFEGMGMYGDFGRYVFQSALNYFNIPGGRWHNGRSLLDDPDSFQGNIYYYALKFIFEYLGYNDELFGEYDSGLSKYSYSSRSEVLKTERIGKKYEWIAMYNILARISDRYKLRDYDEQTSNYRGAWNPDVRDFDPTNNHETISKAQSLPTFERYEKLLTKYAETNLKDFPDVFGEEMIVKEADIKDNAEKKDQCSSLDKWLLNKTDFFEYLIDNLLITDQEHDEWIVLSRYVDKKIIPNNELALDKKRFDTWSWTLPFIAKKNEAESIVAHILAHRRGSIHGISAYDFGTISGIYSKEYPWGPACERIRADQWIDLDYQIYEERAENLMSDVIKVPSLDRDSLSLRDIVEEKVKPEENLEVNIDDPKHDGKRSELLELINMYQGRNMDNGTSNSYPKTMVLGKAMAATTTLNIGFQYDATSFDENGTNYSMDCLCPDITEKLKLRQGDSDGIFYDEKGRITVVDTSRYGGHAGLIIRKDALDKYLLENNSSLFWVVYGEKQYFGARHLTQQWSEWEGAFLYKNGKPTGRLQGFRGNQN